MNTDIGRHKMKVLRIVSDPDRKILLKPEETVLGYAVRGEGILPAGEICRIRWQWRDVPRGRKPVVAIEREDGTVCYRPYDAVVAITPEGYARITAL